MLERNCSVRDHIPLEQGLRLPARFLGGPAPHYVRDHIPLEQGLRRIRYRANLVAMCSQRPYSIRTRIKTDPNCPNITSEYVRDHIPLEQGLRRFGFRLLHAFLVSETIFH